MGDTFAELPEFFETELAESIRSRTETLSSFRELGPPDLCHVLKSVSYTHLTLPTKRIV